METTIFRNPQNLEIGEVVNVFKEELENKNTFSASEIEQGKK